MARNIGLPPTTQRLDAPSTNPWLEEVTNRLKVYSGDTDPSVGEIPENQWIVFNNTFLSETRIWTNIAGTLLKSAAFT